MDKNVNPENCQMFCGQSQELPVWQSSIKNNSFGLQGRHQSFKRGGAKYQNNPNVFFISLSLDCLKAHYVSSVLYASIHSSIYFKRGKIGFKIDQSGSLWGRLGQSGPYYLNGRTIMTKYLKSHINGFFYILTQIKRGI